MELSVWFEGGGMCSTREVQLWLSAVISACGKHLEMVFAKVYVIVYGLARRPRQTRGFKVSACISSGGSRRRLVSGPLISL